MNEVTVKLFGPLREIVGGDEVTLPMPVPCTGDSVFQILEGRYPGLQPWRSSVRLAVNLQYVEFHREIHAEDEVSFIPPVSGG
jgi:molybdopterin converting factor small subunit